MWCYVFIDISKSLGKAIFLLLQIHADIWKYSFGCPKIFLLGHPSTNIHSNYFVPPKSAIAEGDWILKRQIFIRVYILTSQNINISLHLSKTFIEVVPNSMTNIYPHFQIYPKIFTIIYYISIEAIPPTTSFLPRVRWQGGGMVIEPSRDKFSS